ncbi:MAG TPA: SDR family oxidoreductase, partial [Acidimicrobiales bacterium]|nr:SDR family oxidoreductase [Acidimicrobiales bacterium]
MAWVTGASRGLGADIARQLGRAGYDVAITARYQDRLEDVAATITESGVDALAFAADLTDRAAIAAFAEAALDRFGRCDVLCNSGIYQGPSMGQLFLDTDLDELVRHYEADVVAPSLLCQRVLPGMLERGGTIINMSSSSVFLEPPGTAPENGWSFGYVAAKAGLDQLASILNVELGASGIRAFNVEPGFIAYGEHLQESLERYPDVPVSPPEAIGPAIVWLVQSPEAIRLARKRVSLPDITHKHGLLAGWD